MTRGRVNSAAELTRRPSWYRAELTRFLELHPVFQSQSHPPMMMIAIILKASVHIEVLAFRNQNFRVWHTLGVAFSATFFYNMGRCETWSYRVKRKYKKNTFYRKNMFATVIGLFDTSANFGSAWFSISHAQQRGIIHAK